MTPSDNFQYVTRDLEGSQMVNSQPTKDLVTWWVDSAANDAAKTIPKVEEYGTRDLVSMGAILTGIRSTPLSDQDQAVYGCLVYALGKISRAISALEHGKPPSDDTLFDLSVYAMMARRFQENGELL